LSEHARKRARAVLRGRDDGTIILLPDRFWHSWYRHITLSMMAHAWLAHIRQLEQEKKAPQPMSLPG